MATYRLQISMKDADPEISRVVDVPTFACFNDLHSIIQSVMGWMDMEGHLFEKDDIIIGPFEEDVNVFDDLKVPISDYEGIGLTYIYGNEPPSQRLPSIATPSSPM